MKPVKTRAMHPSPNGGVVWCVGVVVVVEEEFRFMHCKPQNAAAARPVRLDVR